MVSDIVLIFVKKNVFFLLDLCRSESVLAWLSSDLLLFWIQCLKLTDDVKDWFRSGAPSNCFSLMVLQFLVRVYSCSRSQKSFSRFWVWSFCKLFLILAISVVKFYYFLCYCFTNSLVWSTIIVLWALKNPIRDQIRARRISAQVAILGTVGQLSAPHPLQLPL